MSDLVERQFPAKALMTGLRAIGYSFSSAVADIIDNSISANASEINIFSDPLSDPYFCVLDNGCGMSQEEIRQVEDPFFTTRKTRKVGLGVPFFKSLFAF